MNIVFTVPINFSLSNWSKEEDAELLKLAKEFGLKWQKIGHKMGKKRFDCQKRYLSLYSLPFGEELEDSIHKKEILPIKWSNIETSKLYGKIF